MATELHTPTDEVLRRVRGRLSVELDPSITNPFAVTSGSAALIRDAIRRALEDEEEVATDIPTAVDLVYDELVGLGPLQPLMADPRTTDILVNRFDEIFVERDGHLQRTATRFRDQAHLEQIIGKIVALVGREISVDKPLVDARMVDGSRANAVYAPVGGPTLCIRKFNRLHLSLLPRSDDHAGDDWVSRHGMTHAMASFLATMARARATILVAGATGAGKSTLLRSIIDAFPANERIVTIEDTAELELDNPHWVRLECVHHHELGGQDTSVRRLDVADLVQNALRMRPDRLIVGEIRNSREAYHALEALNTGHDGSATTIHASSAADALARLELLIGRGFGHLSPREIRGYIARVFDLVIFVTRLQGGHRCVMEVRELTGITPDGDYELHDVCTADVDHQGNAPRPRFRISDGYIPGPRLQRKLALCGSPWTS